MQQLLKTEWLKIKNYTAFKVLSIFFLVGVLLTNYIVYVFNKNVVENVNAVGMLGSFNPYSFENTWQTTSYASGFLLILPALLIIILITNEYTYKTSRQNIIDGWSRQQFIEVKIVMALLVALISTLMVVFTALVFGFFSGTDFSLNSFSHVGFFFLKALSYNMIAVLMSVLIKRTGFAIGLYFIYLGSENIVSQLLDVWSMKIRKDHDVDLGSMGDYLPMNASDGLLTFPENNFKSLAQNVLPTDYTMLVLCLAITYLILFAFFSRRKFIKTDL
jgi:hypothetical protein